MVNVERAGVALLSEQLGELRRELRHGGDFQLSLARGDRGFQEAQTGVVDGEAEVERKEGIGAGLGVGLDEKIGGDAARRGDGRGTPPLNVLPISVARQLPHFARKVEFHHHAGVGQEVIAEFTGHVGVGQEFDVDECADHQDVALLSSLGEPSDDASGRRLSREYGGENVGVESDAQRLIAFADVPLPIAQLFQGLERWQAASPSKEWVGFGV